MSTLNSVLTTETPPTRWSPATRLAFRFCLVYAVLEWVTLGVSINTSALVGGLWRDPNWWGPLNVTAGRWLIAHVLGLAEHAPARLSANGLPLFLGTVAAACVSALASLAWSAVDRRSSSHPRAFVWLHTSMRFLLAATMLEYGWAKILPAQFMVSLDYMALEVGQHNPRDLLWAFMSGSRDYQVFAGVVEVAGALLLLSRRGAMLGAAVTMTSMANVLALDIAYDAPVKFVAGQIFLLSLFVVAPFMSRLLSAFWRGREISAAPIARTIGVLCGVWIVCATLLNARNNVVRNEADRQNPLTGIWDVESMSRNGVPVPLVITDATLWRRLIVQTSNAALTVPMRQANPRTEWTGRPTPIRHSLRVDWPSRRIQLTPLPFSGTTEPLSFDFVLHDAEHLELTDRNREEVWRLLRFDLSAYPLMNWERHWSW